MSKLYMELILDNSRVLSQSDCCDCCDSHRTFRQSLTQSATSQNEVWDRFFLSCWVAKSRHLTAGHDNTALCKLQRILALDRHGRGNLSYGGLGQLPSKFGSVRLNNKHIISCGLTAMSVSEALAAVKTLYDIASKVKLILLLPSHFSYKHPPRLKIIRMNFFVFRKGSSISW